MSEVTPYEIQLNDEPFWVLSDTKLREAYLADHPDMSPRDLGVIAIGIFRKKSYVDYAAIGRVDDVDGVIRWTRAYETYEWLDWMAGLVYRQAERAKQLKDTERKLGRFIIQFGWGPDVVMESEPNENEIQGYIDHIVRKDEVNGQLVIPEDDGS